MNPTIETLPKSRIAYVRQTGPYGPANIHAMEKLKQWAAEKNLLNESAVILGIPQDNPATTKPENCRYDACIVIENETQIDDTINEGELPGGTYAIFQVQHTAEDIQQAWDGIGQAIQNSGYIIDNKLILERYRGDMAATNYCEICVPIKR
jgi:DNA gyrase inhibitor